MTLPTGAERRPSLSSSVLGRGAAQLLTLSQVLPSVCGPRARGLGGRGLGEGPCRPHPSHPPLPPKQEMARHGLVLGLGGGLGCSAEMTCQDSGVRRERRLAAAAKTAEWRPCSAWTAGGMWPCHQRGTRGVWRLHAAMRGLLPAGLGPRRGAALGGSVRGGHAVCLVLEGEGAGVFLGLQVQPLWDSSSTLPARSPDLEAAGELGSHSRA